MTPSGLRDSLSTNQETSSSSDFESQMFGQGLTGTDECSVTPNDRERFHPLSEVS
jgi:hypothetical protein